MSGGRKGLAASCCRLLGLYCYSIPCRRGNTGKDFRLGVNADHAHRESPLSFRNYHGWKFGVAITDGP